MISNLDGGGGNRITRCHDHACPRRVVYGCLPVNCDCDARRRVGFRVSLKVKKVFFKK